MRPAVLSIALLLLPLLAFAEPHYPQNPLLAGDSVFVSQQGVFRFDLDSEALRWASLPGIETFEPVVHDNLLLVGSTRGLYALAIDSGEIVWHIETGTTLFTPAVGQAAYAGSVHGELYSIDTHDGSVNWRRQFPGWIYSPAISSRGDKLWTGGQDHKLLALNAHSGELENEIETSQELVFSPYDLGGERVAVNLFDGSTLLVASDSGTIETVLQGDSTPWDIRLAGNTIYRGHRDGSLSAFDAGTGQLKWRRSLAPADLALQPSQPGYLLIGDGATRWTLLELAGNGVSCRLSTAANWSLPFQAGSGKIYFVQKKTQPLSLRLVGTRTTCQ